MLKKTHAQKLLTLGLLTVCILSCLLLASCSCKHEWVAADCDTAQTCSLCGKTEGNALGHNWAAATCEAPKTCSVCGKTEGNLSAHTWQEATCTKPKTCSICGKKDGYGLKPHDYLDATTEAPKTCSVCGKTTGDPIITDSRFKTEPCKPLFGTWTGKVSASGEMMDLPDFKGKMELIYSITFNNDGTYSESVRLADKEGFTKALEAYYVDALYAEFAGQGLSKEQADAAMMQTYGKNVAEYAKIMAVAVDWDAMFSAYNAKGVYYVAKGNLFSDQKWSGNMEKSAFTISGNTLEIELLSQQFPGLVLSRDLSE